MNVDINKQVFSLSRGWKIFSIIFSIISIALSSLMIYYVFSTDSLLAIILLLLFVTAFLFVALYFFLLYKKYSISIIDDNIIIQNPFGKRKIDIKIYDSYRIINNGGVTLINLINMNNNKIKTQNLELIVKEKGQLLNFIGKNLVSLDEKDIKDDFESIALDQRHGVNEEERINALKKASIINRVIFFLIIGIGVASFFPVKYRDIFSFILCAIPFILLMIIPISNGLIKFDTKIKTIYPSVLGGFTVPIVILTFRMVNYIHYIINWDAVIFPTVFLTVLLVIVFLITNKAEGIKKGTIVSFVFLSMWYGFFASININTLGNQPIIETYKSIISDKKISGGKTTTYYLTVSPWGNRHEENDVAIGKNLYSSVEINDSVTINIYNGKLGIKYYLIK